MHEWMDGWMDSTSLHYNINDKGRIKMYGVRCYNRCSRLRLLPFQHRLLLPLALLLLSHVRETEAFGALREFPPTERGNFTQLADHFSFNTNGTTFPQRYLVYDKFWSPASPGPILFYLGGEGSVENFYDSTSALFTSLGPSLGGLLFFAEHRYYGTSIVEREILLGGGGGVKTGSAQMKEEQSLLTVEQALADFAGILHWFSTKMAKRVGLGGGGEQVVGDLLQRRERERTRPLPVFLFGGSYGGMLAGWFRVKYPHLSHGAVLSSAPVDFYPTAKEVAEAEDLPEKANAELSRPIAVATEFWAAVLRTFELAGGPRCARALTEGIEALQGVVTTTGEVERSGGATPSAAPITPSRTTTSTTPTSISRSTTTRGALGRIFRTCEKEPDPTSLYYYCKGALASLAMVNYPFPFFLTKPLPARPVATACGKLLHPDDLHVGGPPPDEDQLQEEHTSGARKDEDALRRLASAVEVYIDPMCKNTTRELLTTTAIEAKGAPVHDHPPYDYNSWAAPAAEHRDSSTSTPLLEMEPWNLQACTELPLQPLTSDFLGFYPPETTTALANLRRNCLLRFGTEVRPRELPLQFGPLARGGSMDGLRDAIIVDGELDPWRVGSYNNFTHHSSSGRRVEEGGSGIRNNNSSAYCTAYSYQEERNVVKIHAIPGAAHHQDLIRAHTEDSAELRCARKLILDTLKNWTSRALPATKITARDKPAPVLSSREKYQKERESEPELEQNLIYT